MRYSPQLVFVALFIATLSYPPTVPAQQRSRLFGGVRPNLALIDNQQDATLQGTGVQVSAYVGRPFASDFAGLVELGVTTVSHRAYYPRAPFPDAVVPPPSVRRRGSVWRLVFSGIRSLELEEPPSRSRPARSGSSIGPPAPWR